MGFSRSFGPPILAASDLRNSLPAQMHEWGKKSRNVLLTTKLSNAHKSLTHLPKGPGSKRTKRSSQVDSRWATETKVHELECGSFGWSAVSPRSLVPLLPLESFSKTNGQKANPTKSATVDFLVPAQLLPVTIVGNKVCVYLYRF